MRHVEVAAPRCNKCRLLYIMRAGLSIKTGHYEFAWYPDCKCKGREPEVALDKDGEPCMFSLDNLAPQQQKKKAS